MLNNPFLDLEEPLVDPEELEAKEDKEEATKDDEIDWEEILLDGFDAGGRKQEYEQREYFEPVRVGGASCLEAPEVTPDREGRGVRVRLTEGETRLWRVPLAWGERLDVTVRMESKDEATHEAMGRWDPRVRLVVADPTRDVFTTAVDGIPDGRYALGSSDTLYVATPTVAYRNRFDHGLAAVPGDYWVAVSVSPPDDPDRDAVEVPMEVSFHVLGSEEGEPTYPATVTAPGGEAAPSGYHRDRPFLVADGAFAAVVTGDGSGPGWWGVRRGLGLGLAALSLASLAAGGLWLRRVA
jgi:hypothetical protein